MLKLGILAYALPSTKVMYFIFSVQLLSLLWQLKFSMDIMGKVEIGNFCSLIGDK